MNITDTAWMSNPNVKLLVYVLMAVMPIVAADLAENRVSWLSAALVFNAALVAGKAYMSEPKPAEQAVRRRRSASSERSAVLNARAAAG